MKMRKLMLVLTMFVIAVCISACSKNMSSEGCNCKDNACMKNGTCTEECKCPEMKDGKCTEDCMCMKDMDKDMESEDGNDKDMNDDKTMEEDKEMS